MYRMAATIALYARPILLRTAVRRGAASCRAVLGSCPVAAAVRAAAQVPSPRSRRGRPSAPKSPYLGEVGPPSGWSPGARMSGRRPGRSLPCPPRPVPPRRCPSNRSSGHPASTRPVSRRPVSRRPVHPGVRTDRPLVSAALPPCCPCRAGPRSGSVWRAARLGAADRRAVGRGRRGCLPVSGLTARGWRGVGGGWLARGSTVARAAARPASRLRRRPGRWATGGAGQGQGANRVTGEHGMEQVLTGPRRVSWAVVGVVPGHGPGLGGGDHAAWSLARGGPVASSSGDRLGSVGDSLRPQRGRGA